MGKFAFGCREGLGIQTKPNESADLVSGVIEPVPGGRFTFPPTPLPPWTPFQAIGETHVKTRVFERNVCFPPTPRVGGVRFCVKSKNLSPPTEGFTIWRYRGLPFAKSFAHSERFCYLAARCMERKQIRASISRKS